MSTKNHYENSILNTIIRVYVSFRSAIFSVRPRAGMSAYYWYLVRAALGHAAGDLPADLARLHIVVVHFARGRVGDLNKGRHGRSVEQIKTSLENKKNHF